MPSHSYKLKLKKKRKIKRKAQKVSSVILSLFILSLFLAGTIIFTGISYLESRIQALSEPDEVYTDLASASFIYDRNGVELFSIQNDNSNRILMSEDEITSKIKAVFMAAEDSNFYNHEGYDLEAIIRCSRNYLQNENLCGASTITQQSVKLATKKIAPSVDRKVEEIFTSRLIEEIYTKDEIFLRYLNTTPYGSNITGFKTAAKIYFGKTDMSKLTLGEIIILSSIVNDPNNLSPTFSIDSKNAQKNLVDRSEYVKSQLKLKLNEINEQLSKQSKVENAITLNEIEAINFEKFDINNPNLIDVKAGHFIELVVEELTNKNFKNGQESFTVDDLQTGGYRIYTTLDYDLQKVAERYAARGGSENSGLNVHNAAVMTAIPSTGEIITMAGSKNFDGDKEHCDSQKLNCKFDPEVNIFTSLQSGGSTMKMLGFYIGFEKGIISPGSYLPDVPKTFAGGYSPKNWDGKFLGTENATAKRMLRESRNLPALEIMDKIGVNTYLDYAEKFGYTTFEDRSQFGLSTIIGGGEIKLVEHAQAYSVFANQGYFVPFNPILKIEDSNGNIIYKRENVKEQVADPKAAFLLNKTVENLDTGIGQTISWDGRQVAGKTGTTENNRDALLMLYSPDFVTVGWAGNNNNDPLNQLYGWPAYVVAPWLLDYMNEIGNTEYFGARSEFERPEGVYFGGGCKDQEFCYGIRPDWLIKDREPVNRNISLAEKED